MRKKILIVEDEKGLVRLIRYNFEKEGYAVLSAGDGEAGLDLARRSRPDLILLDIMLPRMDGFEFCRRLRSDSQTPVIFLTAKREEIDRVLGLKLGADDYVTKPFSVAELLARVEAVLRRAGSTAAAPGRAFECGALTVDFYKRSVHAGSRSVGLTPKEFDCLRLMIEAEGRPVARASFLERLWSAESAERILSRTVDQHVSRLRAKLGPEGRRIRTVTGAGYAFFRGRAA